MLLRKTFQGGRQQARDSARRGTHSHATCLASQLTPPEDQGGLFGVINAMSGMGRIIGPAVGTFTFARWGGQTTYTVAGLTLALALVLALTLPRKEVA